MLARLWPGKAGVIGGEIAQKTLFCWSQRRSPSAENPLLSGALRARFSARSLAQPGRDPCRNIWTTNFGTDPEGGRPILSSIYF